VNKGDGIAKIQESDMKRKPGLMIIIGTSLKIVGLKRLISQFSETMKQNNKKVVFINLTASSSDWNQVFDHVLIGESDRICERLHSKVNELLDDEAKKAKKRAESRKKKEEQKLKTASVTTDIRKFFKAVKRKIMFIQMRIRLLNQNQRTSRAFKTM
jgi:ElaB/YqjD/DUF883 family membrane-anchored ribosome-binding protein